MVAREVRKAFVLDTNVILHDSACLTHTAVCSARLAARCSSRATPSSYGTPAGSSSELAPTQMISRAESSTAFMVGVKFGCCEPSSRTSLEASLQRNSSVNSRTRNVAVRPS